MDPASLPAVTHVENGHRGAFVINIGGKTLAEMTYSSSNSTDGIVIIDHTAVDDQLRGTGAGKKLLTALVEWARTSNRKVLPLCPFAKSVFEKTPAFQDVLK